MIVSSFGRELSTSKTDVSGFYIDSFAHFNMTDTGEELKIGMSWKRAESFHLSTAEECNHLEASMVSDWGSLRTTKIFTIHPHFGCYQQRVEPILQKVFSFIILLCRNNNISDKQKSPIVSFLGKAHYWFSFTTLSTSCFNWLVKGTLLLDIKECGKNRCINE